MYVDGDDNCLITFTDFLHTGYLQCEGSPLAFGHLF